MIRASMMSVEHAKTIVLNQFRLFRVNLISALPTVSVVFQKNMFKYDLHRDLNHDLFFMVID
jgi:hypothetical protein